MGESYHNVIKEITNAQLSLEDATKRLASKVLFILKDINADEAILIRLYPRLAQAKPFE